MLCVTDATMRTFMLETHATESVIASEKPSDDIRGSISRRMIADKTGLPRETVRRKTQELADAGLVVIDQEGRVRSAQRLGEASFQRVIEDGHRAVMRYKQRLESYGVAWDCLK